MPELHLDLTSEQVGRVCGKGGATIREIRSTTGALLDWHKKFATGSPGTLVVKGLQPQIEQAYAEVQAVLKIEPPACPRGGGKIDLRFCVPRNFDLDNDDWQCSRCHKWNRAREATCKGWSIDAYQTDKDSREICGASYRLAVKSSAQQSAAARPAGQPAGKAPMAVPTPAVRSAPLGVAPQPQPRVRRMAMPLQPHQVIAALRSPPFLEQLRGVH